MGREKVWLEGEQTFNPLTNQWVKRNSETGQFMDVKQDGTPFKGVRRENIRKRGFLL